MSSVKGKKIAKRVVGLVVLLFLVMNIIAFFHAYKFTHFTNADVRKTKDAKHISFVGKIKALFFGINNPRPTSITLPARSYQTIKLQSNKIIECWLVKTPSDSPKGTIILFHGYSACKSQMLDKAEEFINQGYHAMLVDFMGSGGAEGNQTTIGYKEAEEVKTCFEYLQSKQEKHIFMFGTSMGAAAILKAICDYNLNPSGIIIECPFGSMYKTTCARFTSLHVPAFPMADLLVFWGGIQNGFPAFSHNPTEYAKKVSCPTLLLYGEKDEKVSKEEIFEIYTNLRGNKQLRTYLLAAHENYLHKYKKEWRRDVTTFLSHL